MIIFNISVTDNARVSGWVTDSKTWNVGSCVYYIDVVYVIIPVVYGIGIVAFITITVVLVRIGGASTA